VENIISKYDREVGNDEEKNVPQGAASLEGAEYKIDFYAEEFNRIEEIKDRVPARSWVMKTDANGKIIFYTGDEPS
jgi:hypothetical protein